MNFLEIETVRDRSSVWRSVLAIFVIGLAIGGFVIQKTDFVSTESVFNRVLEPLQNINNEVGGDLMVDPPEPIKPKLPVLVGEMKSVTDFTAYSIVVKDVKTGMVMYRKNEYDEWPIASITKLMSALVLLEKDPDWATSTVVIGADSLDAHMYAGDIYTLDQLWYGALVGSSNKAILSLANALDWPMQAFVERMNEKATELGMSNTHFTDPTGIEDTDVSSAADVAILLNEALRHEKIQTAVLTKEYSLYSEQRKQEHHMWNTDWLLLGWIPHDFAEFYGGKTGFINASSYNFTMRVGDGEDHLLDVVILGANVHEARFTEARDVAEWVFENYQWPE